MARKTNFICQNHFKNTDPAAIREAFNKQLAILISRSNSPCPAEKPEGSESEDNEQKGSTQDDNRPEGGTQDDNRPESD